jgi:hypothetical protein
MFLAHAFSHSLNEWEDLNSGIRGWFATKPRIPVEPEIFFFISEISVSQRPKKDFVQ